MHIRGVGRTKFGLLKESIYELAHQAMKNALDDSGLSIKDIDAIYVGNFLAGSSQSQLHLNSVISGLIPNQHIPIISIETACASGAVAVHQALLTLNKYPTVMALGIEKMTDVEMKNMTNNIGKAGDRILDQCEGLIFPATYALVAQQHMMRYGTTLRDLSLVSLKNHRNANLNPLAHFYYKKVDLETIENSDVIASPLRLFDCSPITDGAAALILSNEKRTDGDVKILASEMATDSISLAQRKDLTTLTAAKIAAEKAYKKAGLKPSDIDVAEVHDCFTIAELVAMEDLRFCEPGESKDWVREDKTTLNGELPINTDGGLKADGHAIGASGIAQLFELVVQLRGEAGKRQVDGARIGLAHNIGGVGGTGVIHILEGA
jgi:acetyl-CoA C-acetyltransferase